MIIFVFALTLFACQKPSNNKKAPLQKKIHKSAGGSERNEGYEQSAKDTLQIDVDNTQITWIGRKVTGEHTGTLNLSNGWVVMDKSTIVGGKLIFDMTSISNSDIESPQWKQKLENHLKAEDFFYVDSFPRATLEIKGNQSFISEKSASTNHILANLTIRGITHEIELPYVLIQDVNHFIAEGMINIDRTLYNIQYKSGKFIEDLGDKLIYDDFTVQFRVQTEGNNK